MRQPLKQNVFLEKSNMTPRDCCYEEMSKGTKVLEESEVPMHNEPYRNEFEKNIPGSNGLDQSGMK